MFLEKHSKLNEIEMSHHFLFANRDVLNQTNIQLHLLGIHFESRNDMKHNDEFVDFLTNLYERGFYKSLKLSIHCKCDE